MSCYFCGIEHDPDYVIKIMDYQYEEVLCCNDCAMKVLKKMLDVHIIIPETVMQLAE